MADSLVPELVEDYAQLTILRAVAREERLTDDQTKQLPYDRFMQTVALLHHQTRYQHEVNEILSRQTKN